MHWLLMPSGTWHAWPPAGLRTLCGRVNVEHLRLRPATKIHGEPPEEGRCVSCAKKAGLVMARSHPDPTTAAWIGLLQLHLRRARIHQAPTTAIEHLAELLAEVGSPGSAEGCDVFEQSALLLLKPTWVRAGNRTIVTLPHLKATLALLPLKSGALLRVANTVRDWRTITQRDLTTDNFRTDRVVATMLQLPVAAPYIQHLHSRGLSHLAAVFHPNTLERAKHHPTLRGLFAGSTEYWEHTESQLNIIRD